MIHNLKKKHEIQEKLQKLESTNNCDFLND
jgi:hypothetical protein